MDIAFERLQAIGRTFEASLGRGFRLWYGTVFGNCVLPRHCADESPAPRPTVARRIDLDPRTALWRTRALDDSKERRSPIRRGSWRSLRRTRIAVCLAGRMRQASSA